MSKLQLLHVFLNERLTAAVVEIVGAVEKTVAEYQEENDRLRRMLRITQEIKLCKIGSLPLSLAGSEEAVPPEQQHCEQEWNPSLGQEDPKPTQIIEEEQIQGLEPDIIEFKFTPSCVKSECDQEDPLWSLTLPKTQIVEHVDIDSKQVDPEPFATVTHLKGFEISCDPPDNQNNASIHSSAIRSNPVGLDSSPPLDPSPPLAPTPPMEKPCNFPFYGKTFKQKGNLSMHMSIHTGETPFSCGDCGKCFIQKGDLRRHILTHTGEKPFSCNFCSKSFNQKGDLRRHILTHTGEKPFSCGDCGKSFSQKGDLRRHILTHTGEKPFSCGDCGKSFRLKGNLTTHTLTHKGVKQHGCAVCGLRFTHKAYLLKHVHKVHKERKQDEN
ncbi:zinc finger protein 27-like [Salmo salar]|uniref:Zinc finger protein 27-like n=1 Tax=Salmo salar TaxID=8030 RepID=A0A1S3SEN4_SALSA|nr:zinc finger protein 27-like [Salmo salar]|eukprot:XP_014062800.1 PREDICTED: gastrula zinc finger protein xFG20-1-like [Salmo salar]